VYLSFPGGRTIKDLDWIIAKLPELGFSHFGLATVEKPLSFSHYQSWLDHDYHGDMEYLKKQAPQKENPQVAWAQAQSAFVFAAPYLPHPEGPAFFKAARVALYAQGADYHFWFKKKLAEIITTLQVQFPDDTFLALTDSAPLMERDLAYRAGLGWIGKNTCLIHPKEGSLFLLGEILTSLKVSVTPAPLPDFCGTCQRCVEHCPTQAISQARVLDARKCISYWTIESRKIPPEELRAKFGDWLFGCDVCQTICPWNQKVFGKQMTLAPAETPPLEALQTLQTELRWILNSSGKQIERSLKGSPLLRAGPFGLKRNALIVIANRQIHPLRDEVQKYLSHERLGSLAQWTIQELDHRP
jgi:epoxyqueuosine reductase